VPSLKANNRIESLDSLRGLAAFTVVISHCLIAFPLFYAAHYHNAFSNQIAWLMSHTPLHTMWAGHEAVVLFFILSGFVLALPFLNNRQSSYGVYAVRRICRIYLPYIVAIFASMAVFSALFPPGSQNFNGTLSPWFNEQWSQSMTPYRILSFVLMFGYDTHNIVTSTWSLIHEMRISLIFPFIMFIVIRIKSWVKTGIIGIGAALLLKTALVIIAKKVHQEQLNDLVISFSATFYYSAFFFIGALMAKHREELIRSVKRYGAGGRTLMIVVGILLYNLEWIIPKIGYEKYNGNFLFGNASTIIIDFGTAAGVFFFISLLLGTQKSFMNTPFMLWLGKISYSVYLIHPIILLTLVHSLGEQVSPVALIIAVPVLALLVGDVYYRLVESPSITIGKLLTSRGKGRAIGSAVRKDHIA
jgi:peptidoglycan/LPS O-acetylase OafA/YrhL